MSKVPVFPVDCRQKLFAAADIFICSHLSSSSFFFFDAVTSSNSYFAEPQSCAFHFKMSLNYHELTMTESSDSPHKKMQFGVICTIMGAVIGYSLMTSGALVAVNPEKGTFPGGHYVYKCANRDYAASIGLGRSISQELINTQLDLGQPTSRHYELEDDIYHIYLDNPSERGGMRQRFMSGFLVSKGGDDKIKMLMGKNDDTKRTEFTKDEYYDKSAHEIFGLLPYEKIQLPSVDALVLQFPYTGGIASMMVQTVKVSNAVGVVDDNTAVKHDTTWNMLAKLCSRVFLVTFMFPGNS